MPDLERLLAGLCFGEPAASWALMICSRPNASFTALMLAACIDLRSPGILHGQAFTEVTNEAGLNYNQFASLGSNALETFRMTGGVAAIDYDGDGWTDLFVTRMDAPRSSSIIEVVFSRLSPQKRSGLTCPARLETADALNAAWTSETLHTTVHAQDRSTVTIEGRLPIVHQTQFIRLIVEHPVLTSAR